MEAKANNNTATRSGKITVQAKGKSAEITVTQAALPEDFDVASAIEDSEFKTYCLTNFDEDKNGKISLAEAEKVTKIELPSNHDSETDAWSGTIKLLKGIEYFVNITNLSCFGQKLTELDVAQNTLLEELNCGNNLLTSLRLNSSKIKKIYCTYNNLTSLDLSGFVVLEELSIDYNPSLTELYITGCKALKDLTVNGTALASLDASGCINLSNFTCSDGKLTSLNMSGCIALEELYCNENELTTINLTGCTNLTQLWLTENKLTSINISGCTALKQLGVNHNQLTSINISTCTALQDIRCGANKLTALDVSKNTALTNIECDTNQIESLDLSNCPALDGLICNNNKLTSLDVSKCSNLYYLACFNNLITELDLSQNAKLGYVDLSPMNDASGKNVLEKVIVMEGMTIEGITQNRSTDYIPAETIILREPQ